MFIVDSSLVCFWENFFDNVSDFRNGLRIV